MKQYVAGAVESSSIQQTKINWNLEERSASTEGRGTDYEVQLIDQTLSK